MTDRKSNGQALSRDVELLGEKWTLRVASVLTVFLIMLAGWQFIVIVGKFPEGFKAA
jgi:hypothetical protein